MRRRRRGVALLSATTKIKETYSGAGINVNIPILEREAFSRPEERRRKFARAAAAGKDVEAVAVPNRLGCQGWRWLAAKTTRVSARLDVTERLVAQANESLRLAQARYDTGLGSIVELNQAQLNQTSAQITAASAKYEYLSKDATLNYADGSLR